ncbi:MAG: hypothetical protein RE468_06140 [Acidithiobacillus caldus]|uniref:hypothetical protein n=1 Tax=Acidithiobacillus caldus TaxID=33059 RepID=UPI002815786D|nr:hypothetical protein [Acidithiobacillus caldus]WMT48191.1 MAG: hypothetical protein RE468_06140 [Acidithiobacillus caldus]
MSTKLIKMVKLNNLEYNPNRDPQVYRRVVGHPFRIQAFLGGSGKATVTVSCEGKTLKESTLELPGNFSYELTFKDAGVRIVTLTVKNDNQSESRDLLLDTEAHAKVG